MVVPPTNPATGRPFSVLVDRLVEPSVLCAGHSDSQCYPEHLIVFARRGIRLYRFSMRIPIESAGF
jgi:hypothetical protein